MLSDGKQKLQSELGEIIQAQEQIQEMLRSN